MKRIPTTVGNLLQAVETPTRLSCLRSLMFNTHICNLQRADQSGCVTQGVYCLLPPEHLVREQGSVYATLPGLCCRFYTSDLRRADPSF
jgi:hypothetical protein